MNGFNLADWLNGQGPNSRTLVLRVSVTNPPTKEALERHASVISYGDAVVIVEATRDGYRELTGMAGVLGASTPKPFRLALGI